jgi:hypothetical protein
LRLRSNSYRFSVASARLMPSCSSHAPPHPPYTIFDEHYNHIPETPRKGRGVGTHKSVPTQERYWSLLANSGTPCVAAW